MTESCKLCDGPVNPFDQSTYKQVTSWVHGKKANGATLKEDTGNFAHEACVLKAKAGHTPDQLSLF